MKKPVIISVIISAMYFSVAQPVFAQSDENPVVGVIIFAAGCCITVIAFLAFIFTVWMFVDVIRRNPKVLPGKIKWILLILFTTILGALYYYFTRKKVLDNENK